MVRIPRLGRLRIPPGLTRRWRARLRVQRNWWRRRWRDSAAGEVLFPADGKGMSPSTRCRRAPARGKTGEDCDPARDRGQRAQARGAGLADAIASLSPGATVREVDTLVFASRLYRGTYAASYNAMAARAPTLWGVLYDSWALAP